MWSGHHSSGKLKQSNKIHKGSEKSKRAQKRALGPGKVAGPGNNPGKGANTNESTAKTNRLNRINKERQLRKQKREVVILQKRLGSESGPPKVIAIVPLAHTVDVQSLLEAFVAEASTAPVHGSTSTPSDARVHHVNFARYKTQVSFVVANFDMASVLDTLKVADLALFIVDVKATSHLKGAAVVASDLIVSERARTILTAVKAQGCPEALCCVQGMDAFQGKALNERRKFVTRVLEAEVLTGGSAARVFEFSGSGKQDSVSQLARQLCSLSPKDVMWRSIRSYLLSTTCDAVAATSSSVVRVGGYLRGRPLPVNSLVHVAGVGTGRIAQVVVGGSGSVRRGDLASVLKAAVASSAAADGEQQQNEDVLVLKADRQAQEPLVVEAAADGIAGEQTWPSEAEMGGDDAASSSRAAGDDADPSAGRNRRRVPTNVSSTP
jgi:pre-rRNA-processing protein TSR1